MRWAFCFFCVFWFAALYLELNRRLLRNGLDDLLLLLFSHSLATSVNISRQCVRQQSRRVLVSLWAVACLAFVEQIRCLLTAPISTPAIVEQQRHKTVVHTLRRKPGMILCFTGEELLFVNMNNYKMQLNEITVAAFPPKKLEIAACFLTLRRGRPAAAVLLDTPSCEV